MENNKGKKISTEIADSKWKGLYCLSGFLLIITALIWNVVSWTARILYSNGFPGDPTSYLQLISQHQLLAAITWSLWIFADFLLIAPTIALYIILKRTNRTLALLGSMFSMFFNIYDVCVTELNSLTLVQLSHGYINATTDVLKSSFVAAATYGYHALPLQTVLSFALGTFGYFLWCVSMNKNIFKPWIAIFGAVWNVAGFIGAAAPLFPTSFILGLFQFLCVPAVGLWFIFVGVRLYLYGRCLPKASLDHNNVDVPI